MQLSPRSTVRKMEHNPYQPPSEEAPVAVEALHPAAYGTCPVCLHAVDRWGLYWKTSWACPQCSTLLTLAMPHENKPGIGCVAAALLGIAIVSATLIATVRYGVEAILGLLLLLPLIATYSTYIRLVHSMPYPKSLVAMGRIPNQGVVQNETESQDVG